MSEKKALSPRQRRRQYYRRHPLWGRHPVTLGAIALLGVSGYELWVRIEDFWAWTAGIRHLSQRRGTPFWQDLGIVFEAPEMRQLGLKLAFLVLAIIFALMCLLRRNRGRGAWALLVLGAALAGWGVWLGIYGISNWTQWIKLIPLGLILAGMAGNGGQLRVRRARRRRERAADGHVET